MPFKPVTCPVCDTPFNARIGDYNRAKRRGYVPTCSKRCGMLRRRIHRSPELDAMTGKEYSAERRKQEIEEKAAYDKEYRARTVEQRRQYQAEWYQRNKARLLAAHRHRMETDAEYAARYLAICKRSRDRAKWRAQRLGPVETMDRIDVLDDQIREGLECARLLAGRVTVPCPMCAGSGCVRCGHAGRMLYEDALRLMRKMSGRGPEMKPKKQKRPTREG